MISFGPIPSRRLGKSLGINNIPSANKCSYSCIYCQVGITRKLSITRKNYFDPEVIFTEVHKHLQELLKKNNADSTILEILIQGEYIQQVEYGSNTFYIRKFHS